MLNIRPAIIVLGMLLCPVAPATAQVSIGIAFPNVSIGINLPAYPELAVVPGYPVYYAPRLDANYFFYDGMYWVFQNDNWYASSWYNGPWWLVNPEDVPLFVLRIPVRYYRHPPAYFRGWGYDAPPRWGDHWGNVWSQHRSGWDRWNRYAVPAPAPLPVYQQRYSGDRYPRQVQQQHTLNRQNYHYQPNDPVVRQHYQAQPVPRAPGPAQRGSQGVPQQGGGNMQRSAPTQAPPPQKGTAGQSQSRQPQQQGAAQHQQRMPASQGREDKHQGTGAKPDPKHGQGREQGQGQGQERGRDRDE